MATFANTRVEWKKRNKHKEPPFHAWVGSGVLLGIRGRSGMSIDRLEFIFAWSPINDVVIDDLVLSPSMEEINQYATPG